MAWVRNLAVTALVALIIAWFVLSAREQTGFVAPPIAGFTEGQRIRFLHTETSDAKVAERLTAMTGSPVLVVPSLATIPREALASVYVFTNGVPGEGPFDFQPDVFDHPPGHAGYTPLRALKLAAWKDPGKARELKSAAEVTAALARGEITVQEPGVVINMPLLTWPGGHR
jgi:hypothetical protein